VLGAFNGRDLVAVSRLPDKQVVIDQGAVHPLVTAARHVPFAVGRLGSVVPPAYVVVAVGVVSRGPPEVAVNDEQRLIVVLGPSAHVGFIAPVLTRQPVLLGGHDSLIPGHQLRIGHPWA
jgi:hypothetical protein